MEGWDRRREQQRKDLARVSLLRIELDDEIPLEVEIPSEAPEPTPDVHVFISPDVIEVHLERNQPINPGTAKLIWIIQQLFEK